MGYWHKQVAGRHAASGGILRIMLAATVAVGDKQVGFRSQAGDSIRPRAPKSMDCVPSVDLSPRTLTLAVTLAGSFITPYRAVDTCAGPAAVPCTLYLVPCTSVGTHNPPTCHTQRAVSQSVQGLRLDNLPLTRAVDTCR